MSDLISRAIEAIYACHPKGRQNIENPKFHYGNYTHGLYDAVCAVKDCEEVALPSAEAVSREVYEETDGVVTIKKQNAKEVGEIKHIVIHSPNYTRYFYNESMPTSTEVEQTICHIENNATPNDLVYRPSAEVVRGEWGHMIADGSDGSHWYEYECSHCGEVVLRPYNYCPNCGTKMTECGDDTTGESL